MIHSAPGDSDPTVRSPLCANCMAENSPHAHFCIKCATPMSSLATIDPIGRIHSAGDPYRKAIHQPGRSKVTLIAMWLIFAPQILFAAYSLLAQDDHPLGIVGALTFLVLYCLVLYKTTQNYRRRQAAPLAAEPGKPHNAADESAEQQNAWQCPSCGQSVEENMQICWHCGSNREGITHEGFAAELEDLTKPEPQPPRNPNCTLAILLLLSLLILPFLVLIIAEIVNVEIPAHISKALSVCMPLVVVTLIAMVAALVASLLSGHGNADRDDSGA